jgi:hypothetical protein
VQPPELWLRFEFVACVARWVYSLCIRRIVAQVELGLHVDKREQAEHARQAHEARASAALTQVADMEAKLQSANKLVAQLREDLGTVNDARDARNTAVEEVSSLRREVGRLQELLSIQMSELQGTSARLSVTEASVDAKHALLSQRLQTALHELQVVQNPMISVPFQPIFRPVCIRAHLPSLPYPISHGIACRQPSLIAID